MKKKFVNAFFLFFVFLTIGCSENSEHMSQITGKTHFYEIIFQDKDKQVSTYRQSYYFLPKSKNFLPAIKNNGEIIFFLQNEKGISKKKLINEKEINYESATSNGTEKLILAFPIEKGREWQTSDFTTIKLKMGFDRIYNTNLPFKLKNQIIKTNDTILVNGKKIKDCILISGYGSTSFDPGPPLSIIDIEIFSKTWYSKNLGVIKYEREESSNSATTGNIVYKKTMLFD